VERLETLVWRLNNFPGIAGKEGKAEKLSSCYKLDEGAGSGGRTPGMPIAGSWGLVNQRGDKGKKET